MVYSYVPSDSFARVGGKNSVPIRAEIFLWAAKWVPLTTFRAPPRSRALRGSRARVAKGGSEASAINAQKSNFQYIRGRGVDPTRAVCVLATWLQRP